MPSGLDRAVDAAGLLVRVGWGVEVRVRVSYPNLGFGSAPRQGDVAEGLGELRARLEAEVAAAAPGEMASARARLGLGLGYRLGLG